MDKTKLRAVVKVFDNLAGRWEDESEYEDFDEYKKVFQKSLPAGSKVVRMTSRPFEVEFVADGFQYKLRATATEIKADHWRVS